VIAYSLYQEQRSVFGCLLRSGVQNPGMRRTDLDRYRDAGTPFEQMILKDDEHGINKSGSSAQRG
jgi:hypothetical protein